HARLLAERGGHQGGLRGRLAAHRGPGPARRGRLHLPRRPQEGPDHLRRAERLFDRGRAGHRPTAGRGPGRGGRDTRRSVGRAGNRSGGQEAGPRPDRTRRDRRLPRPPGRLQDPEAGSLLGRAAEERARKNPQAGDTSGAVGARSSLGGARQRAAASRHLMTSRDLSSAIASGAYPAQASIWSVCSPRPGARRCEAVFVSLTRIRRASSRTRRPSGPTHSATRPVLALPGSRMKWTLLYPAGRTAGTPAARSSDSHRWVLSAARTDEMTWA